jgi:hypothetical protein
LCWKMIFFAIFSKMQMITKSLSNHDMYLMTLHICAINYKCSSNSLFHFLCQFLCFGHIPWGVQASDEAVLASCSLGKWVQEVLLWWAIPVHGTSSSISILGLVGVPASPCYTLGSINVSHLPRIEPCHRLSTSH